MSHYLQNQLYEIISSFDPSILSYKDHLQRLNLFNFEPNLSLVIEDFSGVLGYFLVGVNGNQAFVINYGFRSISSFNGTSIFLSFIDEQIKYYPKLKLLRINMAKENSLFGYLEKNGFICQRTFVSYEISPEKIDWKENYNIRLVKEMATPTKMRKAKIKEDGAILIPSCFSDDEIVCKNEYYGIYEGKGKDIELGYLCANEKGEIKQIFIYPSKRHRGFGSTIIKNYYYQFAKWAKIPIRFKLVDVSYEPIHKLLLTLGFKAYALEEKELVKYFT